MSERKLATIQKIEEIKPIEGADKICAYRVKGWWVVDQINKYQIGDYIIWVEIDSWVPTEIAPFLSKGKEPREYLGVKGEKLKTIRLRGQLSQGLILPLTVLTKDEQLKDYETIKKVLFSSRDCGSEIVSEDCEIEVTNLLGIIKWDAPESGTSGQRKGNFPSYISKTDQERVQNIWNKLKEKYNEVKWEVTLKLDGTSFTAYYNEGQFGVCSRNMELAESEDSVYWKIAKKYKLREKLEAYGKNIAIQGECIGEKIQGNTENIKGQELHVFDIYDIDNQRHLTPKERHEFIVSMDDREYMREDVIYSIPVWCGGGFFDSTDFLMTAVDPYYKLSQFEALEDILKFAEGKSLNCDCREGVIFKSMDYVDGEIKSFKVISNSFLLKSDS